MKAWVVVTGRIILPFTIRLTKKQSINDFLADFTKYSDWSEAKAGGYNCLKVDIEYLKEEG
jgi:hypothetical protein